MDQSPAPSLWWLVFQKVDKKKVFDPMFQLLKYLPHFKNCNNQYEKSNRFELVITNKII